MSKIKVVALLLAINLGLLLPVEAGIRFVFDKVQIYDIEMTRYGRDVKVPAENPLVGHVHRPGAERHLMGVDVSINSDGFRDHNYPVERNDAYRMVILGDSLTLGWGVEAEDTFELLRDTCANNGIGLQVVILPELHELQNSAFAPEHAKVMAQLASLGVPALDLAPAFSTEADPPRLWVAIDAQTLLRPMGPRAM